MSRPFAFGNMTWTAFKTSACPGKVGTGFPKKDMRKSKNPERIQVQLGRDAL